MQAEQFIRLLLVDQDRTYLETLRGALAEERHMMQIVGAVSSSLDAPALAHEMRPDVIMLEMDSDQDETIDAIPRLFAACEARILMLAAVHNAAASARAVKAGARGVLLKDDSPELIRKALRKVLEGELWLDRATTARMLEELIGNGGPAITPASVGKLAKLTEREREIVWALVKHDGASNRALAARLRLSEQTLRNHFTSIYRKLGIANRVGLFAYASRHRVDNAA